VLDQVHPACTKRGRVLMQLGRADWACVDAAHLMQEVTRDIRRSCPASDSIVVDLKARSARCVKHS
jgi:hypothetical protein